MSRVDHVATPTTPLEHSNWNARKAYVWAVTIGLFAALILAVVLDRHVDVVAWLMATMFILFLVAPSAEQAIKMLATVAALRAGVAFASTSSVDQSAGTSEAAMSATPASPAPIGD